MNLECRCGGGERVARAEVCLQVAMGGSPKRGKMAAGCMSRGRLILLSALAIQLMLVMCLVKAPRLIFIGTSSRASDVTDSTEEAASGSWLWRRLVVESANLTGKASMSNCTDVNGRAVNSVKCENHSLLRKVNATMSAPPERTRLRRRATIRQGESRHGSVAEEMRATRERRVRAERSFPVRNGSVVEELRVLRQRARGGSVVEDLPVARERRVRVGQGRAAAPVEVEAGRDERISSQLRGSIRDSLERDSFRFRGRGSSGDRLKERAREVADNVRASIAPAAEIRVSARVPSTDPLEDASEDLDEDPDVAIARSEVSVAGRRSNFEPLPSVNATGKLSHSNTSLEFISEASLKNSTELENLKVMNATARSAVLEARNGTLRDAFLANATTALLANVSSNNATLSEIFKARNGSFEDAVRANVSGINATLGGQFGAHNASARVALTANVSGINATLGAHLGAHNATLRDAVSDIQNATCLGGLIYVYTLPKKFNVALLENCSSLLRWGDRCRELSNSGLGPSLDGSPLRHGQTQGNRSGGPWYGTDQFNGEVIFHQRLLTHPCRTRNAELAKGFYIPYYGGLDVARFLFNVSDKEFTAADRDKLGGELVEWLGRSPYWKRHQGLDHFLMLGRITWDFRRKGSHGWGSSLVNTPEIANVTKLALERSVWDNTEMAIPYPTAFHPRDDDEVVNWQKSLRKVRRDLLFSFAGAPRKEFPDDFRINLFQQCKQAKSCEVLDCSARKCEDDSLAATRLFTRYTP